MVVTTVELYDQATDTTLGTIYFNTGNRLWYSDSGCTSQISHVAIPTRSQYAFNGYRNAGQLYVDASGAIVYTPTWIGAGTIKLYAWWTQISCRFVIDWTSTAHTPIFPRLEWYRSVAASTRFYADSQLTHEIDGIGVPISSGRKFNGAYVMDTSGNITSRYIDTDGKFITPGLWTTSDRTSDWNVASYLKFRTCYYMNLNANGGTGGEANRVYYDSVNGKWCNDAYMVNVITAVTLPTYSGKIFKGYYTASSGGTRVIDAHGGFLSGAKLTSANKTFYAQWASPVKITLNRSSGTGGTAALWYGGGKWYDSSSLDNEVTAIVLPTRENHRFLGYYSGSTQVIAPDGTISSSYAPTAAATVAASWQQVSWTIGIELNGGGGITALYADYAKTSLYADEFCTGEPLAAITRPTRAGYRFVGCYTTNDVSGVQVIDGTGAITADAATWLAGLSANTTIYCIWQQVFTITLDGVGGEGAPSEIYYDDLYGNFYDSEEMSQAVTQIDCPRLECFAFQGFYTAAEGGTQRIAADGTFSAGWAPVAAETLYAQWVRRSWRYAVDANGGSGGTSVIYRNGGAAWYADDACADAITEIVPPTRPGYSFAFCYDGSESNVVVDATGLILADPAVESDGGCAVKWTANTYTLNFNYNGGNGDTASKPVTFGQPIGTLPTAVRTRAYFRGWLLYGESITAETPYAVPGNATATANWDLQFGGVTDYFGFGNSSLVPVASTTGDTRHRVAVSHGGKYERGVNQIGGIWRNPSVTYVVKANTTVSIPLGKGFAAQKSGSTMTVSGFMITTVEIVTEVGKFPTVTVSSVANEGANAVNNFNENKNKFNVSVPVVARSKAQNLLGAISGGGYLQRCSLVAACDPVVCEENLMPCASDIVNGRYELAAETLAADNNAAPTMNGDFALIDDPKQTRESDFIRYTIEARKEMV